MLNFYHCFLPGTAKVLKPLTDAMSGTGQLSWTPDMQLAFDTAKSLLAYAVSLQHPHPSAKLSLATDASDTHVGAVLQQQTQGSWQPLAFFSKKLSATETRYSTFDRELLAALSIFGFSWKVVLSHFSLITSYWFQQFPMQRRHFLLFNNTNCFFYQSSPTHFSTCPAIKMRWPTHCHGHLSQPLQKH
jgi:hypothetical protein